MSVFLGNWSEIADLQRDFEDPGVGGYDVVVAGYFGYSYEGSAYVLAESGGQLFECEGGHCSCFGLGGQWKPSPVTREYLQQRLEKGSFQDPEITGAIRAFLSAPTPAVSDS